MTISFEARLADPGPVVVLEGRGGPRSVQWGHAWQIGSAAYWIDRTTTDAEMRVSDDRHRLGQSLAEEVSACILGGYGMPYELGLAAFQMVSSELLARSKAPSAGEIERVLLRPIPMGESTRRYRFPRQRAVRLAGALAYIEGVDTGSMGTREMRDWLLGAPGVGFKTASWIVRNQRAACDVAVLDIHILRAGARAQVFPPDYVLQRDYRALEDWFIEWAERGDVNAGDLDAVIWYEQALNFRTSRAM